MGDEPARPRGAPRRPATPAAGRGKAAAAKPAPGKGSAAKGSSAKSSPTPRANAKPVAPGPGRAAAARSGWLSGIRFSGFSLIMMGVLVLAVIVLAPTIAAFAQQRQQIAELRAAVSAQEEEVQRLRDERERWNDETFIVTQARERLYYLMPGEVSYLVIDDRTAAAKADATTEVSAEVTESKGDWMRTLLDSVMTAGLAPAATAPTDPAAPAAGGAG
jgi:cell division protein FtsB